MNVFRKIKVLLKSVAAKLFLIQILVAGCALIANVFSARVLGPEARGELGLFMQIAYVANSFSVLGRHISYLKLDFQGRPSLSQSFHDIRRLSFLPLVLSLIIAIGCGIFIGEEYWIIAIYSVGFFTLIYSGVQQKTFRSGAILAGNATPYFWSSIIGQVLMLIFIGILSYFDNAFLPLWLLSYGLSVVLPYILMSLYFRFQFPVAQGNESALKRVKRLGITLVPLSITEVVGSRIDRFLIPLLADFAQLGIYTVVVTMTELISWPIKNYADSRVPLWNKQINKNSFNLVKEIVLISVPIVAFAGIVGLVLELVLVPLFGSEFASATTLIWPLVLAAAFHAWVNFGISLCLAAGFNSLANFIPVSAMISSAICYLWLIPEMGSLGAAWGLVIGYVVAMGCSLIGVIRLLCSKQRVV